MTPINDPDPRSTADRNVEQLLSHAYRPESPDAAFASRITELLVQRAADRAERTNSHSPSRSKRFATLAVAAVIAVACGFVAIHLLHHRTPLPVVHRELPREAPKTQIVQSVEPSHPYPKRTEASPFTVPAHRLPDPPVATIAPGTSIQTRANERRRVALGDGSRLFIDQSTRLTVDAPRYITLSMGQVFVQASPRDASDPFIVYTPRREVRAIGTRFNVHVESAGTAVVVSQGNVHVDGIPQLICAGQQIAAHPNAEVETAPATASVLDWARDLVGASQLPLAPPSGYAGGAVVLTDSSGRESRLALRKYLLDVHIEDGFARTTVDQTWFNEQDARNEGTFYFPLPPDASISRLAMYVNGKLMEGGMAERNVARQTYESIVRTARDPALLEWMDGNIFKMRVFPLEPRQEKRIILSYVQRLPSTCGKWEYRFPAARNPGGAAEFAVHARIRNGVGTRWDCPSHALLATVVGTDLVLDGHESLAALDRDVVLDGWEKDASSGPTARFAEATLDGHRYLMVRCQPALHSVPRRERRDWIFIFEAGGSRDPVLARAQVDAIAELLANGERDDTFQIVAEETRARSLTAGATPATPENIREAVAALAQTHLVGGLDLGLALDAAGALARESHDPWIVHVGVGLPTLGERRTAQLIERIPAGAHYVGIGIGKFWGRAFMKSAAEKAGGYFTQINSDESIPWRAIEISSALNSSRLLQLRVSDDAGKTFLNCDDMISAGQEICAVTRLEPSRDLPKSITLAARLDGKEWNQTFSLMNVAKDAGYLPRLWAKLEIDRLVAEDPNHNHDAIVKLSKSMYVMSPFTSLLVLENDAMYAQFNIDRGRKDHWALYPCPEQINVINEPRAASRNDAAANVAAAPNPSTQPAKPSALDILQTIVTRPRPMQIDVPIQARAVGLDFERLSDQNTVTRVYDVRDLIGTHPDFNDAPDFSLESSSASATQVATTRPPASTSARTEEERALEDLKTTERLREIQRQQDEYESQQKARQAVAAESSNLDQARQLYSQALSLDPDNAQAKAGLSRVLILQGRSTGNTSLLDQQAGRIQQQTQMITYQFDQAIADARAAAARKDFRNASVALQRAQIARNQNPNIFTTEALRNYDNQIRETQLVLETGREHATEDPISNREKETAGNLLTQKHEEEIQRRETLDVLRATAMRLTEDGRYSEAIGVVDQISVLDPTDEYALGVRPMLEDKFNFQQQRLFLQEKDLNFTRQLNASAEKLIPYDDILRYPADWPDINHRRDRTVQAERGEHQEDRAVQSQLDRVLPEMNFDAVGFNDLIDFLRDVSGANIFVNWKGLERIGVDRNAPVTLCARNQTFSQVLQTVLASADHGRRLGYAIDDGVITISPQADLDLNTVTRVYDLRDFDAPSSGMTRQDLVNRIVHVITNSVAPGSWRDNGGAVGTVKELSGQLIVTQTAASQRQIINLLAELRQTSSSLEVDPAREFAGPFDPSLLVYRRPTCQTSATAYSDLLQWAPGLNTTREDRAALIERDAAPLQRLAPGRMDPGARDLIEHARQQGWQRVTVTRENGASFDLLFDGFGRYVCERRVGLGLLERTICDGKTLVKLYPEIGIGAKREMSRFQREPLLRLAPWALPPAEELACGAEVIQVDAHTVEISRHDASMASATTKPSSPSGSFIRLIFAPDGRLAGRQLIGRASKKPLYAESYDASGRVTAREGDGPEKLLMELKSTPADPPDLAPHDQAMVVLPMPWLTRRAAHSEAIDNKAYADWSEDEALRVIAADVAAHDEEAASIIAWRFFRRGDCRIGFHVLMLAGGIDWGAWAVQRWGTHRTIAMGVATQGPMKPLEAYLNWGRITLGGQHTLAPPDAAGGGEFFRRLLEMNALASEWKADSRISERQPTFDRALAFIRDCPDTTCAWNVFALVAGAPAKPDEARLLADAVVRFTKVPALEYSARYERACDLWRAGETAAGQKQFESLYRESIDRGVVPPIETDFRIALGGGTARAAAPTSQPQSVNGWSQLLREACDKLRARAGSRAALAVAWQAWELNDSALADELLDRALAGATPAERDSTALAAVDFLDRVQQPARALALLQKMLERKPWSESPDMWRLAVRLCQQAHDPARELACLERAVELEQALGKGSPAKDAADQAALLAGYRAQADAAAQLGQTPPARLKEKIVRAADRWRADDSASSDPFNAAGEALRRIGEKELAWSYFTTPLSENPTEAKSWEDLAQTLQSDGDVELADRAYAEASIADPADAQLLYDRATFLERSGRPAEARSVYARLAQGDWDEKYTSLKALARDRAR